MKKFIIKHGDTFFKISFWILIYLLTYACIIFNVVIRYFLYCLGIQSETISECISWEDCSFLFSLFVWLTCFTVMALAAHFIEIGKNVKKIVNQEKEKPKLEKENTKESCLFSLIDNVMCPVIMPFVELFVIHKPFATFVVLISVWIMLVLN